MIALRAAAFAALRSLTNAFKWLKALGTIEKSLFLKKSEIMPFCMSDLYLPALVSRKSLINSGVYPIFTS